MTFYSFSSLILKIFMHVYLFKFSYDDWDFCDFTFFTTKLKLPNVVTFHGMSLLKEDSETRVIIVMEYCTGNLKNRISSNPERALAKSMNADAKRDAYQWIKQIVAALSFNHDQRVVHRDLKLDNILVWNWEKSYSYWRYNIHAVLIRLNFSFGYFKELFGPCKICHWPSF